MGSGQWADELLPDCKKWLQEESEPQPENAYEAETICENEYGSVLRHKDCYSLCFYIDMDIPFQIGEQMNVIHKEAYMNGYNWEAFFNFYLPQYAPDLMIGLDTDSEAGMYVASYHLSNINKKRAETFLTLIKFLMENEKELYRILKEDGDKIEWD